MVADPVLIDTARHYAELDALDALERYTEAHGEPSWETCEYYPDECAGCKIRKWCASKKYRTSVMEESGIVQAKDTPAPERFRL